MNIYIRTCSCMCIYRNTYIQQYCLLVQSDTLYVYACVSVCMCVWCVYVLCSSTHKMVWSDTLQSSETLIYSHSSMAYSICACV